MRLIFLILISRIITKFSCLFNLGSGSTWPGHLSLKLYPELIPFFISQLHQGVILIAGTNGKTTTSKMIKTILENNGFSVIQNEEGANLLNGIASSLLHSSNLSGKINKDYAIFEIDEAILPLLLKEISPRYLLLLNLFRDQLDRYGEINVIVNKWAESFKKLRNETTFILNADDPEIAFIGKKLKTKTVYFGLNDEEDFKNKMTGDSDSTFCPNCHSRLTYDKISFSHLGYWKCLKCDSSRPDLFIKQWENYPLPGVYNKYNTLAAITLAKLLNFSDEKINQSFSLFKPAFGRQEEIIINNKKIHILLSKNPAGFNESLKVLFKFNDFETLVLSLNDRIPDGRDISWIYDVDFEQISQNIKQIIVTGDRSYDLALRLKYADFSDERLKLEPDFKQALKKLLGTVNNKEIFILANYSAMLEIRKYLSGKKLL